MLTCTDCGRDDIRSPAGLASHRRSKHPDDDPDPAGGPNLLAAAATLRELERMGRLEKVDTAAVTAVRSIAAALDAHPFNSQMWREYREALKELAADGDDGGLDDDLRELFADPRDTKAT